MALYWNDSRKTVEQLQTTDAAGRIDLIPIEIDGVFYITIPDVEYKYIKVVNGELVEMTLDEKKIVNSNIIAKLKKNKRKEALLEAERRITSENTNNEPGPFLGLDETELGLKIISALSIIIKVLGSNLKNITEQEKTTLSVIGLEFYDAKKIKEIADKIYDLDIADPSKDTEEEVKEIKIKDNTLWIQ